MPAVENLWKQGEVIDSRGRKFFWWVKDRGSLSGSIILSPSRDPRDWNASFGLPHDAAA